MNKDEKPKITIKEVCVNLGLSHRQLAEKLGSTREHVQRMNTGKRKITKATAKMLEKINKEGDIENKDWYNFYFNSR